MHAPLVIFYGDSSAIEPQISALKTIHSCFREESETGWLTDERLEARGKAAN